MWGATWIHPGAAAPPHPGNSPSWPCTAPQGHPALGAGGAAIAMMIRARLSSLDQGGRGGRRAGSLRLHLVSHPHTYTLTDTHAHIHMHSQILDTQGHSGHSLTVMHTFIYTHRHSTLMDTQGHSCTHSYTLTDTRAHGHSCALEDIHTHHEHMRVRGHSDTR